MKRLKALCLTGARGSSALAMLIIASCGSNEDNRWSTESGLLGQQVQPDFNVSSTAIPQSGDLRFSDLADPVAAAFVDAAAKIASTPDQLLSLLRTPINLTGPSEDATQFQRVLVLNVFEIGYSPGDSLVQTRMTIVPRNFKFANLNAAKTEYSTIDIDKITTTNGLSSTASIQASPPIPIGQGSLSITDSHNVEKSEDVAIRVEDLSVNLENGSLSVFRQGGRGRDLTGDTIVKLSIQDASSFAAGRQRTKFMVTGMDVGGPDHWKSPSIATIDIERRRGLYPTGMIAEVRLNYVLRHVVFGARTYEEGDDEVRFETGCVAKEVVVVPPSDTALQTWTVNSDTGAIQIDTAEGYRDLTFSDYPTAARFLTWVRVTHANSIGEHRIRAYAVDAPSSVSSLSARDRSSLEIASTTGRSVSGSREDSSPHACNDPRR